MVGRLARLVRQRRFAVAATASLSAVLLAACGGSTVTITAQVPDTSSNVTVSSTVTSDPAAIDEFTKTLIAADAGKPASGVLHTGDVHVGSIVCTYTLNKSGWQFVVSIYVVGHPPGVAALCSKGNQQSLLKQLP
jgi:hypothetical protein